MYLDPVDKLPLALGQRVLVDPLLALVLQVLVLLRLPRPHGDGGDVEVAAVGVRHEGHTVQAQLVGEGGGSFSKC